VSEVSVFFFFHNIDTIFRCRKERHVIFVRRHLLIKTRHLLIKTWRLAIKTRRLAIKTRRLAVLVGYRFQLDAKEVDGIGFCQLVMTGFKCRGVGIL
jgi:hypothetical protein